jgi:L-amino acid N-acyltransferase YncA
MTIRDAREADLSRIVAIYNESIPGRMATADTTPVTVDSRLKWFADHTPHRRPLWVAEEARDHILGWLSFQDYYGRPACAMTADVSVYVTSDVRRQGVGRQLLRRGIEVGPSLRLKTLLASVFTHNTPSMKLFAQAGFEQWGLLPRVASFDGVERDVAIFGLRIEK